MRNFLLRLHRWTSLGLAAFWIVQVMTGVMLVFHWELDNLSAGGGQAAFSPEAISARLASLEADVPGRTISSVWTSGGDNEQFDIYVREPGAPSSDKWRINGGGEVLRVEEAGAVLSDGAVFGLLVNLHTALLGGPVGHVLVGISGIVLFTNLLMGAWLAWPKGRQWRALLRRPPPRPAVARNHGWHRRLGLCLVLPALVVVGFGTLLSFEKQIGPAIAGPAPDMAPVFSGEAEGASAGPVSPAAAIEAALSLYPDASLTALRMPTETRNAYQVLLRQPGEANRIYGRTEILVSAATGDAVLVSDPFDEPPGRAFMAALFPVHTGQVLGLPGRVAVLATGCGLLALMVFGVMLFAARLQGRRRLAR